MECGVWGGEGADRQEKAENAARRQLHTHVALLVCALIAHVGEDGTVTGEFLHAVRSAGSTDTDP